MERGISDLEVEDVGLAQIPSPVYPRSSSMERRLSPNYSRTSSQERRLSPVTTRSSSQERRLSPVIARSSSQERRLSHDLFLGKPRGPRRLTREEIIHKYCEGDVSLWFNTLQFNFLVKRNYINFNTRVLAFFQVCRILISTHVLLSWHKNPRPNPVM